MKNKKGIVVLEILGILWLISFSVKLIFLGVNGRWPRWCKMDKLDLQEYSQIKETLMGG